MTSVSSPVNQAPEHIITRVTTHTGLSSLQLCRMDVAQVPLSTTKLKAKALQEVVVTGRSDCDIAHSTAGLWSILYSVGV